MSSNWSALYAQLLRSVNRHSYIAYFPELIPNLIVGQSFRTPAHLLDWLHGRRGDQDRRNAVLRALHSAAVGDREYRKLATEVLILALWPGLCTVRRRLRRYRAMDQLDDDLIAELTMGILRSDPEKVNRVAATLLRNLQRDLLRSYRRDARLVPSDDINDMPDLASTSSCDDSPEKIMKAAWCGLGDDGLLLALVHVAGFSQKDAARGLGITHDAARKRCQRSLARLQKKSSA